MRFSFWVLSPFFDSPSSTPLLLWLFLRGCFPGGGRGLCAPSVAVIVAAHDEEAVIERRIENLLALDYPRDRLEIVVTSDASTDRTEELAAAAGRARDPQSARRQGRGAGPRRARDRVGDRRVLGRERDLGARRAAQKLVRPFADPTVAYVCGQLRLQAPDGSNKEGLYWRYEMAVRAAESTARLGHRRQRLDLRGAARRLRRGRSRASGTTSRCPT